MAYVGVSSNGDIHINSMAFRDINCKSVMSSKEQLEKDLKELKTKVAIGKKYGVSDNSVKNG